jgi:hypothetical protein
MLAVVVVENLLLAGVVLVAMVEVEMAALMWLELLELQT